MRIPTKSDWGVIEKNNLDAECAFEHFAEKSLDEALGACQFRRQIAVSFYGTGKKAKRGIELGSSDGDPVGCPLGSVVFAGYESSKKSADFDGGHVGGVGEDR